MAFKLEDVMADAGRDLNDLDKKRWPDADRLAFVNEAIAMSKSLRPDLFLSSLGAAFTPLAQGDTVPVPDRYRTAMVAFVKARCLERQTDRKNEAEAQGYMKLFTQSLGAL